MLAWISRILGWIVALVVGSQGIYALLKEPLQGLEAVTAPRRALTESEPADPDGWQDPVDPETGMPD
ncbi:hypothetical protein ACPCG0_07435 [Propionibacteriaceae bacterium Y1923]|uniref:hypothetical protein n=1 Tax=Aestuariimicrobium sp. Y1814 TaxID=3418742 RepID=UPI003C187524